MTVMTKGIGEKKPAADKMEQPLVVDDIPEGNNGTSDPEAGRPPRPDGGPYLTIKDQVFILRRANLRTNFWTLYCLLFTAMLGMGIGVIGGLYVYRHYARDQMHRFRTGWYSIPYEGASKSTIDREGLVAGGAAGQAGQAYPDRYRADTEDLADSLAGMSDYFKERFEIDLDEHYEEIDVPDFRGGRQGRFIHDFNNNLTGIVDMDGQCCFVMPLDRERVLPPRSMYDLLSKMYDGYYEVNTKVVRETMRAVFPPIRDLSTVGAYIGKKCKHMPTYRLERINSTGIAKRSAPSGGGVYGHFAGKNIDEWEIVNIERVLKKE